jgi:hypothetical protein
MIRSVDALVGVLGAPDVDLDGRLIHGTLRRPMVYVWFHNYGDGQELVEYVGKTATGIARPLSSDHHRRDDVGYAGDRLLCWCVESEEAAAAVEAELIVRCKPRLNVLHPTLKTLRKLPPVTLRGSTPWQQLPARLK